MATASQYNGVMAAYNRAQQQENYSGGPLGSQPAWNDFNTLLDRYGIGNGSGAGVPGFAGFGAGGSGNVTLGGTGQNGGPISFNLNPQPQSGAGTFGAVPGAIGAPPSLWDETNQNVPGLAGLTSQTSNLIGSQLNGNLSPSTIGSLTDSAAARGVSLGQGGGTGLTNEILLKTLGLTHEQLQQQGLGNYLNFLGATSSLQQKPELLAEIASRNATMAAAPNPTLASQYLMGLSRGTGTRLRNPFAGFNLGGMTSGTGTGGYGGYGDLLGGFGYNSPAANVNVGSIPGYNSPSTSTSSFTGDNSWDSYYNSDIPAGTYMGEDAYYAPGYGPNSGIDDIWSE